MKIKALAGVVTKAKQLVLYDDADGQWAGDGMAAYLLPTVLGKLSTSALIAVLDIPTDKAADMLIRSIPMPEAYDTDDDGDDECDCDFDESCRVIYNGRDMIPLRVAGGKVYLIQSKYLKPITDAEGLRLTLRRTEGGQPYIAAKDGMFITAIIMPLAPKDGLSDWLGQIETGIARARSTDGTDEDDAGQM